MEQIGRTIAIGDIHGCSMALKAILHKINPQPNDLVITLGDYVDRGPDSKGVIEQLLELSTRCILVPLSGNHEQIMLAYLNGQTDLPNWLAMGGSPTLESYGFHGVLDAFPPAHVEFLKACGAYYETDTHFFLHASYNPKKPLNKQKPDVIYWQTIRDNVPGPHRSGKVAIVGHTPQRTGDILYMGHLICIDTGCCYGKWLTAIEVQTAEVWQANIRGELR